MQIVQIQLEVMNANVNQDLLEMEHCVLHVLKMNIHLMIQHVSLVLKTQPGCLSGNQLLIVNVIHLIIILILIHQLVFLVNLDFYWMMIQILVKVISSFFHFLTLFIDLKTNNKPNTYKINN